MARGRHGDSLSGPARQSWRKRFGRLFGGFGYLTLDPSPRLRERRGQLEREAVAGRRGPLPPLPDSAYGPDAVLLEPQTWPPED